MTPQQLLELTANAGSLNELADTINGIQHPAAPDDAEERFETYDDYAKSHRWEQKP